MNTVFTDFFYRLNFNSTLLSFYSLLWTTSTYVSFFFWFFFVYPPFWKPKYFLFTLFPCVCLIELGRYTVTPLQFLIFTHDTCNVNPLLLNDLNKYHPFILYSAAFLLLVGVFENSGLKLFYKPTAFNFFRRLQTFNALVTIFALFLGSWWAAQENSWGGWWAWDASEFLGLAGFIVLITFYHQIWSSYFFFTHRLQYLFYLLSLVFLYFFTQTNFELISHNFGIRFGYFFNNSVFLIQCLFVLFSTIAFFTVFTVSHRNRLLVLLKTPFNSKPRLNFFGQRQPLLLLAVIVVFWSAFFLSFAPLFTFFSWNFFFVNWGNTDISFSVVFLFFYFLLFICFHRIVFFFTPGSLALFTPIIWLRLRNLTTVFTLHLVIGNFFVITYTAQHLNIYFTSLHSGDFWTMFGDTSTRSDWQNLTVSGDVISFQVTEYSLNLSQMLGFLNSQEKFFTFFFTPTLSTCCLNSCYSIVSTPVVYKFSSLTFYEENFFLFFYITTLLLYTRSRIISKIIL